MASRRSVDLLLTLISIILLLTAFILPALRTLFTAPSENLVDKVALSLSPFDYFYLSKINLNENWSYKVGSFDEGNTYMYYDPSYNCSSWSKINVPFLFKATYSNYSLWVRTSFKIPNSMQGQKLRLIFSGVWEDAKVWLNGIYLGEHVGYFSPFFFDIDGVVNLNGTNVLTLYVESPVQDSYGSRVYPTGIYSFSDFTPDLHTSLIGIWRDVTLVGTYEPVVDLVLANVKQYSNPTSLSFQVLLQNKGSLDKSITVVLRIGRFNSNITDVEQSFNVKLSANERRWSTFEVSSSNLKLWYPWDIGHPNVYFVNISLYVGNTYAGSIKTMFGIRSLEGSISEANSYIKVNSINVFLRGGSYFSKLHNLVDMYSDMNKTLNLLKDANVNFLRAFAHVEPREFYELTSSMGFVVQVDFPLLGSYPVLDRSSYYSDLVKMQLVELLLLTYNYPSVTIVCPHVLPGWINKNSPYYSSSTNYYLDRELDTIVSLVNKNIILLPYSGYYDEYISYGWGVGSWTNYFNYKGLFPNVIVPTSLPNLSSPFWNKILSSSYEETLRALESSGLNVGLASTYWLRKSQNLSNIVELSQTYQSLVIRSAIDRVRLLKNNASIGIALLPLTDYVPKVSGSVIDYFGVRKLSYYAMKNAFNPIHTIISIDGDFHNNLTSLYFVSGSTARISFWVVNDALQDQYDAVLNWNLTDVTSGKLLVAKEVEFKLPSLSMGAILVAKDVLEVPTYVDTEHLLEVSASLLLKNGTKIDFNSNYFVVKPASLIRLSLAQKPSSPQFFLVFSNESYRVFEVYNGSTIPVPSNTEVTIVGPLLNKEDVYVPEVISLGRLAVGETKNVTISLWPGAIAKVLASVPSLSNLEVPSQEIYITPSTELPSSLILSYTSSNMRLLNLLNITGNVVVVPANVNLSLLVIVSSGEGVRKIEVGNFSHPIFLSRNSEVYLDQPALYQVKSNQPLVNNAFSYASNLVNEARERGFYVGLELDRLNQLNKTYSVMLNSSDPLKILAYQQEIVTTSALIVNSVQNILKEAYTNQIMIFIVVILLVLALGSIFIEKKEQYAIFTIISFIILMTISYQTFPGFSRISSTELMVGIYLFAIIFLVAFLAPYFLGEAKSEGGVSLLPAIIIAISYSIGNLKKRRLRTLLVLISITVMVLALTTLTSMKASYMTNSLTVAKSWPANEPSLAIITKSSGSFTPEDISFIGAQREIQKLGYKVITPVTSSALGYVGNLPIYGVRGISENDPSISALSSALTQKDAIRNLFNGSDSVLISQYLAARANLDVGMTFVFKGIKLKVAGIFDSSLVSKIKEPDGSDFPPLYLPPGSQEAAPQPVPVDSLLITTTYTAQKLGGYISAVYCFFNSSTQAKEVSQRLAAIGSYFVTTLPSSENIRYYFKGTFIEAFGTPIVIPMLITVLNIAIVFYTTVYERRNEIFTFSAVGLNPTHISSLFVVEASILGLIGGGVGYILSMLIFRIFGVSNLIIPVDVKTSASDMFYLILASILVAIIASGIPALRAARIATPSLLRKWRMEESIVRGGTWTVQIPMRIPSEKVEMFANYLYERLPQSGTTLEIVVSEISREEKIDENGNIAYYISFKYGRGGNRPFNAYTTVEVRKEGENYIAYAHVRPESVYARMAETNVHEVVSHIRRLILEWSASKARIAIVIGNSIDQALIIVRNYHPQLLIVYSRADIGNKLRELRRKLRAEGIWPPAIEVRNVETKDVFSLVNKLSEDLIPIDTVCLDSDDGLLSSALAIATLRLNKNIAIVTPDEKVYEVPAGKFVEYMQKS
ncbi:MAG: FtsX-like permease family protein [Thermoproteota archaeon]